METLVWGQTESYIREFREAKKRFRELITQENQCWHKSVSEAIEAAKKAMQAALSSLSRLYDPKGGEVCYVSDTKALLYNTQLDAWQCDGVPTFTVVLTPAVLSELVRGNDKIQPKAEKLMRLIRDKRGLVGRKGRPMAKVRHFTEFVDELRRKIAKAATEDGRKRHTKNLNAFLTGWSRLKPEGQSIWDNQVVLRDSQHKYENETFGDVKIGETFIASIDDYEIAVEPIEPKAYTKTSDTTAAHQLTNKEQTFPKDYEILMVSE